MDCDGCSISFSVLLRLLQSRFHTYSLVCLFFVVRKKRKGTSLSIAHTFSGATPVSSAALLRTAASFHAAAFDPCGLLLWCAVPECSSHCSKLTERWKEAEGGVHGNHLCSSIPRPRGPCKVTVFLPSPVLPFLAHHWFFSSGWTYIQAEGWRVETIVHPSLQSRSSFFLPPASSSAVCVCVCVKSRAGGGTGTGDKVCLFSCLFAPDFSGQSCAATSQSRNALTAAAVKSCDMFSALHHNCCCMCCGFFFLGFVFVVSWVSHHCARHFLVLAKLAFIFFC